MIRLVLTFFIISSCSNIPISYKDLPSTLYRTAFGYPDILIDQDIFDQNRYSFATVSLGKSKPLVMVLLSINNGLYTWVDSNGARIVTRNGRIIQIIGLSNDIDIRFKENKQIYQEGSYSETVNFSNPLLINADLFSIISFKEKIDYTYLNKLIKVNVFIEEVSIKDIGWKKENKYFLDQNNREIKTIQFVHPFLDQIKIEFYYK